ncbi:MAG TPA: hypothetical protein VIU10_04975 [Candidatus Udaeobacter sp.]
MVRASRKRFLLITVIFAAVCVVGYILSPYRPVEGLRVAHLWLLISVFLFIGSVFLVRRVGGIGALLQLVGSAALLLINLFDFITNWIGHYAVDYGLGDPIPILRSLQAPIIQIPVNICAFLTLLFPIGF